MSSYNLVSQKFRPVNVGVLRYVQMDVEDVRAIVVAPAPRGTPVQC